MPHINCTYMRLRRHTHTDQEKPSQSDVEHAADLKRQHEILEMVGRSQKCHFSVAELLEKFQDTLEFDSGELCPRQNACAGALAEWQRFPGTGNLINGHVRFCFDTFCMA